MNDDNPLNSPDKEFKCVMNDPPKLISLKSETITLIGQDYALEGFTRDRHGSDIQNGVNLVVRKWSIKK